jgi:methylaspartate ammonia-lyase
VKKIVDVVTTDGHSTAGAVISIGVRLDDGQIGWGEAVELTGFSQDQLHATVHNDVRPALVGQTLDDLPALMAQVDALTERVTLIETIQPKQTGVSRRSLFTGIQEEPEPIVRESVEIRPIFPSVRYAVTQAVLNARALAEKRTPVAILCTAFDLPAPKKRVPLHAALLMRQNHAAARLLYHPIQSLGLTIDPANSVAELGAAGVDTQRAIRELKSAVELVDVAFYLSASGGYGELLKNDIGKILGSAFGLETAAKPQQLYLEDPLIMPSRDAQIKKLGDLRAYFKIRRMRTKMVGRAYVDSMEAVRAFVVDKPCVDLLWLDPLQLGSLHNVIVAAKLCREWGVGVIVGGSSAETILSAHTAAHLALAIQADLLFAKPATQVGIAALHNEMARMLAQ